MNESSANLKESAPAAARRLAARHRRRRAFAAFLVAAMAIATAGAVAAVVAQHERRSVEADLQARTSALARTIDLRLLTFKAALSTIAQSSALREDFDFRRVEKDARRIGALYGGWFTVATGGDTLQVLMTTASERGVLPSPEPRRQYPEVARAEAESLKSGRAAVSDAFPGRVKGSPVVTVVTPVDRNMNPNPFIYFSVGLADLCGWLANEALQEGEFAALADGSRRVIARSENIEQFMLRATPAWYVDVTNGRDSGVAHGMPIGDGAPRLFAFQRLSEAPAWTLAISSQPPTFLGSAMHSAWPALSALAVTLLGAALSLLMLDRRRAREESELAIERALERELILTELRSADKRKSRLMAVLAHDLRAPLVAMLASFDMFKRCPNREAREQLMDQAKNDGHGMLQLIDDVLELAVLGSGEARLRPQPFDPVTLLNNVRRVIKPEAEQRGVEVRVESGALPECLLGDTAALQRVLVNFGVNAAEATLKGTITLSVSAGPPDPAGREMTFAVSDTGRGVAPEDIPLLFRDFGTLERLDTSSGGTGLGLAICRRLAEAMGGEVGAESRPGGGSRFWLRVTLPQARPEDISATADHALIEMFSGMRILVAEDHETIRRLTSLSLEHLNATTVEAEDGIEAVELAGREAFDLVLMDLRMPRMDGAEAASHIRRGGGPSAQAKIIGVTAHQTESAALMLSDQALDACLPKPLDLHDLAALLQDRLRPQRHDEAQEMFDPATVDALRALDGGASLSRSLTGLARELTKAGEDFGRLIDGNEVQTVGSISHRLSGLCLVLGARSLAGRLRTLEELAEAGETAALRAAFSAMTPEMERTREAAERMARDLDSTA